VPAMTSGATRRSWLGLRGCTVAAWLLVASCLVKTEAASPAGLANGNQLDWMPRISERRGVGVGEGEADGADVKRGRFRTFADRARARIGARAAQVMGREKGGKDDHGVGKAQGDDVKRPGMAAAFGTLVGGPMHSVRKLAKRADSLFQGIPSPLEELIAESRKGMTDALGCLPNSSAKRWRERQLRAEQDENTVSRQLYSAAPIRNYIKTTSSFRSYREWTGNGIKSITVLKESQGSSVVRYQAGALGLNFDFTLKWTRQTSPNHVPYVITFENVRKEGLVGSLSGAYMIDQVQGVSVINFDFSSSLSSRVPKVITKAIGNLVVDIATGELRKYVEERTLATMQLHEDPVIAKSDVATFEQLQKRAAVLQVRKRRRDAMRNARKGAAQLVAA